MGNLSSTADLGALLGSEASQNSIIVQVTKAYYRILDAHGMILIKEGGSESFIAEGILGMPTEKSLEY